jgi:hypothetical protein
MSLAEENRLLLKKMQMEKARSNMREAEVLLGADMPHAAAGRVYYAVFHAVCALLLHDNLRIKSHKGAYTMFCLHYVNTGIMPLQYGKWYRDLEIMREESDYNCFYDVTVNDVQEKLPQAREMMDRIAALVEADDKKGEE